MEVKSLIIGLGTGRCGTTTMASILDHQKGVMAEHEYLCEKEGPPSCVNDWSNVKSKLIRLLDEADNKNAHTACDIALYHLWYVERIMEEFSFLDIKFLVLERDLSGMVQSFLRKMSNRKGRGKSRNPFNGPRDYKWDYAFPDYEDIPEERSDLAFERYWYHYMYEVARVSKIPRGGIHKVPTGKLNDEEVVKKALKHCGISNPDLSIVGSKENKSPSK